MKRLRAILPLLAGFGAASAPAQERCTLVEYQPPAEIADQMRAYLVCGLLQGRDGHFTTQLNGESASIRGGDPGSCDRLRLQAIDRSELQLENEIPVDHVRRAFVANEFEKADLFLQAAARSNDLAVGQEAQSPQCRISNAENR